MVNIRRKYILTSLQSWLQRYPESILWSQDHLMMMMMMMISKYDDHDDDEIKIWWCWLFCSIVTSAHKGISSTVILELREIFCQNLFISKHLNTSLHNLLKTGTFYDVHVMSCCVMIMNQCWKKEEKTSLDLSVVLEWTLHQLLTNSVLNRFESKKGKLL